MIVFARWAMLILFCVFCACWLAFGALKAFNGVVREMQRLLEFAQGDEEA
ncbi:MAG: hypothetical protein IIY16_04470 [Oscillospiraceae bacterium]|nr:hypothetical protein [Oscillospiraceae bacterium]